MYNNILVPIDLGDAELAKSAISTAVMLVWAWAFPQLRRVDKLSE